MQSKRRTAHFCGRGDGTKANMKLNHLEVGEFCVKKNITSKTQLYAEAMKRKDAGECDLALYVMNNPKKRIAETIMLGS